MRAALGRTLAVVVGVTVGLLLLEVAIRAARLDRPSLQLALVGSSSPTSAYDPRLGWVNLPDSAGWLRWPGGTQAFHLTTNHQGFRFPRDFTRHRNRPHRLAIVGDSQVFGFVVGDDEHLSVVLERDMPDVETYPFGVPGYGPTQEMLLLENTVLEYEPEVVVAVLFLHNDLNDETQNLAYGFLAKPFMQRRGDAWTVTNVPVPLPLTPTPPTVRTFLRANASLFDASAIYRLLVFRSVAAPALAEALARVGVASLERVTVQNGPHGEPDRGFRRFDGQEPACNVVGECPLSHWLDGLPAAVAAYEHMADVCTRRGIRFFALVAPPPLEMSWRQFSLTEAAVAALQAKRIDTVSLQSAFMSRPNPMDLIAPDRHWNAEGTRVAAAVITHHVRELLGSVGEP